MQTLLKWITILLPVLLSVAFYTLLERQILAAIQRRQGPNVIGFYGILQAIADGVKLLLKETVIPRSSDKLIFVLSPILTFALALSLWPIIPINYGFVISDFNYGILYIFTISSLSVHSVIMAGWSSNSKYAFLGALRSAAQMISYEVSLGVTLVTIILLSQTLNLTEIVLMQKNLWNCIPLFPMFIIFFICILAETNRHPFDLPEAESELVSGYNVEYAAFGFALFFLAEYSNIIVMCVLITLLFLGGWNPLFSFFFSNLFANLFTLIWKTFFFMVLFVLIRGTLPRYRYDQLMRLGWKIFLPISLFYVIFLASFLILIL
uniref:NADH-ubiquinone oxidoreductase chain 1 n=1 Tax=Cafileria marina TaxID=2557541 RepID=A0A5B9IQ49_9STRA|nr:NADH dehydrogenase subunit 1 [Cafileria marina]QEF30260.1 NADH dehydrogenase subunit 1 [Cafileria marina]